VARVWFGVPGGYCRGVGKWSFIIDHGWLAANKRSSPFPRDFDINLVFKNVFQQRYRDFVRHAISTREELVSLETPQIKPNLATAK
jgi:hypothetical protein